MTTSFSKISYIKLKSNKVLYNKRHKQFILVFSDLRLRTYSKLKMICMLYFNSIEFYFF